MEDLRSEIRAAFETEQAAHPPAASLRRNVVGAVAAQPWREPRMQWVAIAAAVILGLLVVAGLMSTRFIHHPSPAGRPVASPSVASLPNIGLPPGAIMIPLSFGHGDETFPAFTATGQSLFVGFACRSSAQGSWTGTLTQAKSGQFVASASDPCVGPGSIMDELQGVKGELILKVRASSDTAWEVYVTSGPSTTSN